MGTRSVELLRGARGRLLGGLCTILRPMQAAMTGPEFRTFMERFLRYADAGWGKVFNYAWSGATTIASIVALVLLFEDPGSTSFVLTAIGLGVWIVGVLVVSNVWKTPTYKVILAGDPEAMPADWEAVRQRYFTINWLQFATTWAAFALFLVALISLERPPWASPPPPLGDRGHLRWAWPELLGSPACSGMGGWPARVMLR
jgi:hypothetical protein